MLTQKRGVETTQNVFTVATPLTGPVTEPLPTAANSTSKEQDLLRLQENSLWQEFGMASRLGLIYLQGLPSPPPEKNKPQQIPLTPSQLLGEAGIYLRWHEEDKWIQAASAVAFENPAITLPKLELEISTLMGQNDDPFGLFQRLQDAGGVELGIPLLHENIDSIGRMEFMYLQGHGHVPFNSADYFEQMKTIYAAGKPEDAAKLDLWSKMNTPLSNMTAAIDYNAKQQNSGQITPQFNLAFSRTRLRALCELRAIPEGTNGLQLPLPQ